MGKSPAFQFYPQDFISDLNVQVMPTEAIGAYILLLCHDWIEGGIPDDDRILAIITKTGDGWVNIKEHLFNTCSPLFKKRGNRYYNARLNKERQKQLAYRKAKSEAGKASVKARRARASKAKKSLNEKEHLLNSVQTNFNSSSSSSSSDTLIGEKGPIQAFEAQFGERESEIASALRGVNKITMNQPFMQGVAILADAGLQVGEIVEAYKTFLEEKRKDPDRYGRYSVRGFANNIDQFLSVKKSREGTKVKCKKCGKTETKSRYTQRLCPLCQGEWEVLEK